MKTDKRRMSDCYHYEVVDYSMTGITIKFFGENPKGRKQEWVVTSQWIYIPYLVQIIKGTWDKQLKRVAEVTHAVSGGTIV